MICLRNIVPDAKDEKFLAVEYKVMVMENLLRLNGKILGEWRRCNKGTYGKMETFWLIQNSLSEQLKSDLGRRVSFPFTLLMTTETYTLHPTPFNQTSKSVPTDLKIYVTPEESFVAKMKNVFL